ncbi:LuxR C-terminal-related transcriptional regulator [Rhodococcus antarcticus]|uniref:LuxR C-terminal-related transcriptional regulator n=1 Tax=Rhodococcus antarcticus TaxID=2987751 RepID=A0ABY6P2H4_9NOCA|nr:LuxR family transcriptional regulator [Rhodococcus antarcticus]UZJ25481.1 LuxR C-terminal-related transcriptional regulator [Rhodococcus antarcticus]
MASLVSARSALDAGSWLLAIAEYRAVAEETGDPLAHEGLAQAAWWLDDAVTCVGAREQAYRRHRALGDPLGAARAATALAWDCLLFGHGEAVALGWWGRAGSLLEELGESAEHGWHAMREAELALEVGHDPDRALGAARRAAAVGKRLGLGDLEVVGVALQGLAMTSAGDVEEGMVRLDASVAAAISGDVPDPMWMGKVCCWVIAACNHSKDVTRAADWCRRVEALCTERDLAPLFTVCRIQHATVQVARGSWREAEQELVGVLDQLSASRRASRFDAVVQLGELRRRQGRVDEAEALFAQAEFHPSAIVGRARMLVSAGDPANAWASIAGLLARMPPDGRLARTDVLLPAVLVALAAGCEGAARVLAAELRATAELTGTHWLMATASVAEASLQPPSAAVPLLTEAVRRFNAADLRFDEAHTRLSLAEALLATGEVTVARRHLALATEVLTELCAGEDLARARRLAPAAGVPSGGPLSARERQVLRLVSQGMSNQEIAVSLVLSEHTVHRHVANILTKLGQTSRTGAASHAIHAGLL